MAGMNGRPADFFIPPAAVDAARVFGEASASNRSFCGAIERVISGKRPFQQRLGIDSRSPENGGPSVLRSGLSRVCFSLRASCHLGEEASVSFLLPDFSGGVSRCRCSFSVDTVVEGKLEFILGSVFALVQFMGANFILFLFSLV